MNLIGLADRLGKTIAEIEQISLDEFTEWVAYFEVMDRRVKDGAK